MTVSTTGSFIRLDEVTASCPLPAVHRVRRHGRQPQEPDVAGAVRRELARAGLSLAPGSRIAITVGSRGLHDLVELVRAAVEWLRVQGAEPFVVPAMGSHGHATAEGQQSLLVQLGVTEASVGAPIRSGMATVDLGGGPAGVPVHMDALAAEADGVLVVNRVKPHTDFHGPHESGLAKMAAIGLGNQAGAATLHALGPARLSESIVAVARAVVARGKVIGGLGVVENGRGQTAGVAWVPPQGIGGAEEAALLAEARRLLGTLPFDELDVLVVDSFGKNVSGSGMDTNVIGRRRIHGVEEPVEPRIANVVALGLTPDSEGNGYGIGLADFTTREVAASLDLHAMYTNALTAGVVGTRRVALPMVLADPVSAVSAAVLTCGRAAPADVRLVRMHDTLDVADLLVSPALLPQVQQHSELELVGGPVPLVDGGGSALAPWGDEAADR
ncbi:nickel pincer cofactor-dependent isomerase, group 22 [Motilibacter aurantiacus]|uniref:DUF362 domain-containing protein n=1 Tax=Motilibacter aurantiacus TaxID=2714955 RepID=UPI00140D314E|nr:DUF362 domain-containing protein [Motilibacter aurantiacus]NHC46698.1 DUF2088 domain-containing protein [Motilibacter aurantiacus]